MFSVLMFDIPCLEFENSKMTKFCCVFAHCSPTVDTDSPYVIHPVKTDTFPGKTNTTFQTNIKIFASKEGQHKICASVFGKK